MGAFMIDQLEALRDLLAEALADADCPPDIVALSAGRPNAPVSPNCTAVYVWAEGIADLNQGVQGQCQVRGRFGMAYEIWVCFPIVKGAERVDQLEPSAECLIDLMTRAWCALAAAKDSGQPFGDCNKVELLPLAVTLRQAGHVSALGGVTIPMEC